MEDFLKKRTTMASRLDVTQHLEPPTFTICLDPPLKTSLAQKHNFSSNFDWFFEYNKSLSEGYDLLTYKINRDYELKLKIPYLDRHHDDINLFEGNFEFEPLGLKLDIAPIQTMGHGTCLKIQSDFNLKKAVFALDFRANQTLKEIDKPNKIMVLMTSKNDWHGILGGDWPQHQPSKFEAEVSKMYSYTIGKVTEYLFDQGVDNPEECWSDNIKDFPCPTKCQFASYAPGLPMCSSIEEVQCMGQYIEEKNLFEICNRIKRRLAYYGDLTRIEKHVKKEWTTLRFEMRSLVKEIKEEVEVISLPTLIGSVGGSLGMFFGFSILSYALFFFDKCIIKILKKITKSASK